MSYQIIQIPKETNSAYEWALWSTVQDDFVDFFADDDEITRYLSALAYEAERTRTMEILQTLKEGGKPYHQFTLTWGEANELAYENHPDQYDVERKAKDAPST